MVGTRVEGLKPMFNVLPIVAFIDSDIKLGLKQCLTNLKQLFPEIVVSTAQVTRFGRQMKREYLTELRSDPFYSELEGLHTDMRELGKIDISQIHNNRYLWDTLIWTSMIKKYQTTHKNFLLMNGWHIPNVKALEERFSSGWQSTTYEDVDLMVSAVRNHYGSVGIVSSRLVGGPILMSLKNNPEWERHLLASSSSVDAFTLFMGKKIAGSLSPVDKQPLFDSLELVGPPMDVCDRMVHPEPKLNYFYEFSQEANSKDPLTVDIWGNSDYIFKSEFSLLDAKEEFSHRRISKPN